MKRAKAYTMAAVAMAFGLFLTANQAQAQNFRLRVTRPVRVGKITILPSITVGNGYRGRVGFRDPICNHHTGFRFYRQVDLLALRLARDAKGFLAEVHANFRRTPQYRHLDHDAHEMEELADHIHEVAVRRGSVAHLRADLRKLDRLYHHVEQLVAQMARCRGLDYRAYRHLRYTLSLMGHSLHDMARYLR